MIETVLALVPDYGLILVFVVVMLACMAVPLPASILVLTAGSFAAVGDLSLLASFVTTFAAYVVGDQVAFNISRVFGRNPMATLAQSIHVGPLVTRSRGLLDRYGALAVFLSHTIFSPTCPYVTYLCGAGGLSWARFTAVAVPGAMVWSITYVGLGYVFASQLEQVSTLISDFLGIVLSIAVVVGALHILRKSWETSGARDAV